MDTQNVMATIIDPRLHMMDPGTTTASMQYSLPTSFEPWSGLFETLEFPPPAQGMGMMETEFQSDSASPLSSLRQTDNGFGSPLSALDDMLDLDEGPGDTSISPGPSEAGAGGADNKAPKTTTVKRSRRRRSETEKKDIIKQRNRVAASKCRQKKKEKVDELKEMKTKLEARNADLHLEFQRLRQEIGQIKSHLIHHTDCNDPNIDRWVENEAKGYVQKLVRNSEQRHMSSSGISNSSRSISSSGGSGSISSSGGSGSISSSGGSGSISSNDGVVDGIRMHFVHSTVLASEDPYRGLG